MENIKAENRKQVCTECKTPIPHEAAWCPSCGVSRPFQKYGSCLLWVLVHPDLSASAKMLYGILAAHASYKTGDLNLSVEGIVKHSGMSRSAVNRGLAKLQEVGAIVRTSGHREWARWFVRLGHLENQGVRMPEMALKNGFRVPELAHRSDENHR